MYFQSKLSCSRGILNTTKKLGISESSRFSRKAKRRKPENTHRLLLVTNDQSLTLANLECSKGRIKELLFIEQTLLFHVPLVQVLGRKCRISVFISPERGRIKRNLVCSILL
ncbi:unnamed protein product [Larinioides sclopetarius]|uniref:Uncharacterized protein n=1 Tax=Larinioides sclopetarius TaxID=280406 RepID=A0AAV2AV92_9ARAC